MNRAHPFSPAVLATGMLALAALVPRAGFSQAPSITQQPQSRSVVISSNASFSVTASGSTPLRYRWSFNGTNLSNSAHVGGATNSTLTVSNVVAGDAGNYRVVVTNRLGSVTSSVAALTVQYPPSISDIPDQRTFHSLSTRAVPFTVGDVETPAQNLTLSASSSNPGLVPTNNVVFGGSGSNRTVTVTPASGGVGTATITVKVRDADGNNAGDSFILTVADFTLVNSGLPGVAGGSAAWGDYDNDGKLDVLLNGLDTNGIPITQVFRNTGSGIFTNCGANITGAVGGGACWGDYNNDGRLDFMVSGSTSNNHLQWMIYRNDGSNTFTQSALLYDIGFSGASYKFVTLGWADFDNDGDLDPLFAGWPAAALFRNDRNDTFVNTGLGVPTSSELAWADYDNDGDMDLVIPVSGGSSAVTDLYQNDGHGGFTVNTTKLMAFYEGAVAWGDIDNDGDLDIAFTGFTTNVVPNTAIFRNNNNGASFSLIGALLADQAGSLAWGDFNNDGNLDLVVTRWSSTRIYWNDGTGNFYDSGILLPGVFDGTVACGDFDNDGDLDILICGHAGGAGGPPITQIWRNDGAMPNTPPNPPGNLTAAVAGTSAIFSWSASTDSNQTGGFSYNLRIGRTPGGAEVCSPMADAATGYRRLPALGNAGERLSWTITNLAAGTYYWSVQAIDHAFAGSAFAQEQSFALIAPAITNQPSDQSVIIGSNAVFSIGASGTDPLRYQWFMNGNPISDNDRISGAATSSLSISNVQDADYGFYTVAVSNAFGGATSTGFWLSLLYPPTVLVAPPSQTNVSGSASGFSALAAGTTPFGYQWFFNGAPLADGGRILGATSNLLFITNLRTNDAGGYQVVVTNVAGVVTSAVVNLAVLFAPPVFGQPPQSQTRTVGDNATFSSAATGSLPLSYQWFFNGAPLADDGHVTGSSNPTMNILNVQTNDAGNYWLVASNPAGMTTGDVATLTVLVPPTIVHQPASQTNVAGLNVTFAVGADGTAPLDYQWRLNGANLSDNGRISGATGSSLTISNLAAGDAGNYDVVVTNDAGSATSGAATLTVLIPPSITGPPKGRSVPPGLPTVFNATASGTAPLSYQWQLNGTNIPGATGNNYTNSAVTTNDTGAYQLIVTNAGGAATSSVAMLTIGPVAAWGNNTSGQALPPPGLSNVIAIAGGSTFSLALKGDGTVAAWGAGAGTNVPINLNNIVAIAAGSSYGLAVRSDGIVQAWGSSPGTNVPVTLSNAVLVAGALNHGMALRSEGIVVDWGTDRKTPPPLGLSKVVSIADGIGFSLVARADGTVVTWGGPGGQLSAFPFNVPAGLSNVVSVAAGSSYALALKSDGRIVSWGGSSSTNVPANATNVIAMAAANGADQGAGHNLALRSNGLVVAWGSNSYGQTNVPAALSNVVAVAAGTSHSLAIVSDGAPLIIRGPVGGTAFSGSPFTFSATVTGKTPLTYSWSLNGTNIPNATNAIFMISSAQPADAGVYQLTAGNASGVAISVPAPVAVMDSAPFILSFPAATNRAYIGSPFTLSATPGGSGPLNFQWQLNGQNIAGGTNADLIFDRVRRTNTANYTFIASNSFGAITSSVAALIPVSVVAWGGGVYGVTNVPVSLTNAVAISINSESAAALRADGTVATWGFIGSVVPADVSNAVEIATGSSLCLALRTDGTVRSWNASAAFSNSLAGLSNIVAMEADSLAGTFLGPDGTVTRILNSGVTNSFPQLTNVIALSKFYDGFAAVRADGTVFTSGSGTAPPASATSNILDIAMERTYGAVLKRDGSIQTWGLYSGPTNFSGMIAVSANAGVRSNGTVVAWLWTPNNPALATVPSGLASVGAVDASSIITMALPVARDVQGVLLPDALNATALVVSSRNSPQWFGQTNVTHDGVDAAQSADIGNNTASSMRMWVAGPVNVSFWWKVSSQTNHHFLSFSIGGAVQTNISGEKDWQQCTIGVPAGNQILQWTYSKDASGSAGQDAGWVDQLVITPIAPSIVAQPQSQTVLGGSNVTFIVSATGTPPLSYLWRKNGTNLTTTTPFLMLPNVTRTNSGGYSVVVTNVVGSMTSSNAMLTVHVPQLLFAPLFRPDGTSLVNSRDADGGALSPNDIASLQAQVSTNLMDWAPLPGALTITNGMLQLHDPGSTNFPTRFYRILENW